MFIYCGYPTKNAIETVLYLSEMALSPKPSGGYLTIKLAKEKYPENYYFLEIELPDNAQLDERFINSCTKEWKIYRDSDVINIKIYND